MGEYGDSYRPNYSGAPKRRVAKTALRNKERKQQWSRANRIIR